MKSVEKFGFCMILCVTLILLNLTVKDLYVKNNSEVILCSGDEDIIILPHNIKNDMSI